MAGISRVIGTLSWAQRRHSGGISEPVSQSPPGPAAGLRRTPLNPCSWVSLLNSSGAAGSSGLTRHTPWKSLG